MSWTDDEVAAFGMLLLAMGEVFNEPVSPMRAELFCRACEDVPFAAMQQAANAHIRTATFFPKPAELRAFVLGRPDDQAELAWQHVLREVKRVGYIGKPTWPDAATEKAALGLFGGGWRTLCEHLPGSGPELLGFRKSFVAVFGAAARQAAAGELPPSRSEAKAVLADLKSQLAARGLPAGKKR